METTQVDSIIQDFVLRNDAELEKAQSENPQLYDAVIDALNFLSQKFGSGEKLEAKPKPPQTSISVSATSVNVGDRFFGREGSVIFKVREIKDDAVYLVLEYEETKSNNLGFIYLYSKDEIQEQILTGKLKIIPEFKEGDWVDTDEHISMIGSNRGIIFARFDKGDKGIEVFDPIKFQKNLAFGKFELVPPPDPLPDWAIQMQAAGFAAPTISFKVGDWFDHANDGFPRQITEITDDNEVKYRLLQTDGSFSEYLWSTVNQFQYDLDNGVIKLITPPDPLPSWAIGAKPTVTSAAPAPKPTKAKAAPAAKKPSGKKTFTFKGETYTLKEFKEAIAGLELLAEDDDDIKAELKEYQEKLKEVENQ